MRSIVFAALAVLLAATPAHARPGDLDRSFANGGRVAYKVFGSGGGNHGMALLDGRRPLLSVSAFREGRVTRVWMRLTTAGRVASRSEIPGPAEGSPRLAGGYALTPLSVAPDTFSLARVDSTEAVRLTLPRDDFFMTDYGFDGSGRIIAVGYTRGGPAADAVGWAVRFLPSGQLDTSYADGGIAILDLQFGQEVLVRSDGRAYIAGRNPNPDRLRLIALDERGRTLRGFAMTPLAGHYVYALEAGPGKTVLMSGERREQAWIARFRGDGRRDRRFGDDGLVRGAAMNQVRPAALTRDGRGRLVLAGSKGTESDIDAAVLRFSPRGRIDRSFGNRGSKVFRLGRVPGVNIVASSASYVAVDDRGRIVVAGGAYDDEYAIREDQGNPYPAIARLQG